MLQLFVRFELGKIAKYFKTKTLAKVITALLFLAVFGFVSVGIYFFFLAGFRYINIEAVEDIRTALTLFLYEIFLVILAGVIMFSAMVTSLFTLFRGQHDNWVLGSPSYAVFPKFVLIKSLLTSLLPSAVLFVPAVLAFNHVYNLGVLSLLLILISVILFLIIINALTLTIVLVVGYLYYLLSKKLNLVRFTFRRLISLLILLSAILVTSVWKIVKHIDLIKLFRADEASDLLNSEIIGAYFHYLPTHPFALEIVSLSNNNIYAASTSFGILAVLGIFCVTVWWLVSPAFYPLWQKFQEGASGAVTSEGASFFSRTAYIFSGGTIMALFKKEALVFTRNSKGVLWFLFLFLIWLLQVGANTVVGHTIQKYQPDLSQKVAVLQAIQFIIAIYFISSFALRFVFPSFSVEKKTSWILLASPINFRKIFYGKYFFYTSFFVVLGLVMSSVNATVTGYIFGYEFYLISLFIAAIIFIVTLGISLGAIFPSTESDDPETVSTSMPGLFFTALSLAYGALATLVLYRCLVSMQFVPLIIFIVVTLFSSFFLAYKTPAYFKIN